MKKIIYLTLIILGNCLSTSTVKACHDYSDTPLDYVAVYHNDQRFGYLGDWFDWEKKPDYQGDGIDRDNDGVDGDKYDDGLSSPTLSGDTWVVTPGENALLTFTARQLTSIPHYNWVKIWIDWNKNKVWENNEQVIKWEGLVPKKGNVISVDFNLPIPTDFTGETWLRARISSTNAYFQPSTSGNWLKGEVEDYKVIGRPTPPTPEPNTLLLLGSGVLGLAGRYIRKKLLS